MARRQEQPGAVIWRRRWWILLAAALFTVGVYVAVGHQTAKYKSVATIAVGQADTKGVSFDSVQANQAYTRTLAKLIGKPTVADEVVSRLSWKVDRKTARAEMTFDPLQETQLLEVTAEDPDPQHAKELANTWATVFTEYAAQNLKEIATSAVRLADPAVTGQQSSPRPKLAAALALLLALLGGCAVALLLDRLDRRVRDAGELSEELGVPVLATLPKRQASGEDGAFAESIRVLRTNLQFVSQVALRSVSITSTHEGEGKSTVAAELMRSFALLSLVEGSVLGVDADLRRPALLARLGLKSRGGRGLTDVLVGEVEAATVAQTSELAALRVIGPGALPANPSTLLGFASSREKMVELGQSAPVVVWDTPPVEAGADAALVSACVDGVIIVVDLRLTTVDELRRTIEQIHRVSATVLGLVVNRDNSGARKSAYSYGGTATKGRGRQRTRRRQDIAPPETAASAHMGLDSPADAEPEVQRPMPMLEPSHVQVVEPPSLAAEPVESAEPAEATEPVAAPSATDEAVEQPESVDSPSELDAERPAPTTPSWTTRVAAAPARNYPTTGSYPGASSYPRASSYPLSPSPSDPERGER